LNCYKCKQYLFLYVYVLLALVLVLMPLIITLSIGISNVIVAPSVILDIVKDHKLIESLKNSIFMAFISGSLSLLISVYMALNWFYGKKSRLLIIFIMLVMALVPADIYAIGVQYVFNGMFGIQNASMFVLLLAHCSSSLPYSFVFIIFSLNMIDKKMLISSYDIGATDFMTISKIMLPLIYPSIISAYILSFIISINEFSRTYYLSGPIRMLSKVVYGAMSSGSSPKIYILGGASIIAAFIVLSIIIIPYNYIKKISMN